MHETPYDNRRLDLHSQRKGSEFLSIERSPSFHDRLAASWPETVDDLLSLLFGLNARSQLALGSQVLDADTDTQIPKILRAPVKPHLCYPGIRPRISFPLLCPLVVSPSSFSPVSVWSRVRVSEGGAFDPIMSVRDRSRLPTRTPSSRSYRDDSAPSDAARSDDVAITDVYK